METNLIYTAAFIYYFVVYLIGCNQASLAAKKHKQNVGLTLIELIEIDN